MNRLTDDERHFVRVLATPSVSGYVKALMVEELEIDYGQEHVEYLLRLADRFRRLSDAKIAKERRG